MGRARRRIRARQMSSHGSCCSEPHARASDVASRALATDDEHSSLPPARETLPSRRKQSSAHRRTGRVRLVQSSDVIRADVGSCCARASRRGSRAIGEERVSPDRAGETSNLRKQVRVSRQRDGPRACRLRDSRRGGDRFSSDTKAGRRSLLLQPHSGSAVAQQSHCWAHSAPSGSSRAPIRRAVWAGTCAHRGVAVESCHGEHHG